MSFLTLLRLLIEFLNVVHQKPERLKKFEAVKVSFPSFAKPERITGDKATEILVNKIKERKNVAKCQRTSRGRGIRLPGLIKFMSDLKQR